MTSITFGYHMRLIGLACTAVAVLWATGVAAATTWEDIKRESERHGQLESEVYGPWSPEAFDGLIRVKECLANNACARNPCKPIEKQLDWLGSYCRALVAEHEGNERKASSEFRNAFRLLLKHYPTDEHVRANRYVSLASEERDRQSSQQLALVSEVTNYTAWRFGQALLAQHARELERLSLKAESGDPKAQFDYAWKLYNDRSNNANKAEAARWFRKAAEQGHAAAQNNLGAMYEDGEGVAKDDAQAVGWYRKAADQGDAVAQRNLGEMYAYGRGVAKDDALAVAWYRKAAEQGDAAAQANLGFMYETGRGVSKDDALAVGWYRKAAEQGHAVAQNNLGIMYSNGEGVAKDDAQAVGWYRKAAEQGFATAQANLGLKYGNGQGVAKDDAQAVGWYRKAAEQGDARAQFNLGVMYHNGRGVAKDDAQAVGWHRKAAEQGHTDAQFNLGVMYGNGEGVAKDDAQAVGWYRKAAEQGHAAAQNNLGSRYANGQGVAKDDAQAVGWYRKAAEQGYPGAQNWLGLFHASGRGGLLQDNAEAAAWFIKAASQGDSYAQRNLALFYRDGVGVDPAPVTAYAWMNLSAAGGHENAPSERDQIAAQLSAADLKKGQQLSREWKPGQLIPVVRAAARPAQSAPASPRQASGPFPARPAKVPGRISCNTRCVNGDCYRTYDDGRQERFQAQRRMNAFGEWEWDSGSC